MVRSTLGVVVVEVLLDEQSFLSWGWRVPFLARVVLVAVGLYIRVGILESPVFAKLKQEGRVVRAPLLDVFKNYRREVVLTALLRTGQHVPFYVFSTYVLAYATQAVGMSRIRIQTFVIIQSLISLVTIAWAGQLSDLYGRRRITAIGCITMAVVPFIYFRFL